MQGGLCVYMGVCVFAGRTARSRGGGACEESRLLGGCDMITSVHKGRKVAP